MLTQVASEFRTTVACAIGERFRFLGRVDELASAPGTGDPREQLREIAELAMEFYGWYVQHRVGDQDPEVMQAHAQRVHANGGGPWRSLDRLAGWLAAEQDLGRLHPDADPHAAATAFLGACMWHAVLVRTWGTSLARRRARRRSNAPCVPCGTDCAPTDLPRRLVASSPPSSAPRMEHL